MRLKVLTGAALFAVALLAAPLSWADDKKTDDNKADDTYTLKPAKKLAKGKSVKVDRKEVLKTVSKITDDNGNALMDVNKTQTFLRTYVEKTLETNEKTDKRSKFSRKFAKAKDVEDDESENKKYHERTVLFEKSDGDWKVAAEGNPELSDDELKDLAAEVNQGEKPEQAMYPKKPVKVGDKWTLDGKDVAKLFPNLKMVAATVKGEGKLVKVYKKDGKQWGTLDYAVTFESELSPQLKPVKGEMKLTSDEVLDGSSTAGKGKVQIKWASKQTIEANCQKINVDFKVDVTGDVERTDVKGDEK